jgi:hypothetical protein
VDIINQIAELELIAKQPCVNLRDEMDDLWHPLDCQHCMATQLLNEIGEKIGETWRLYKKRNARPTCVLGRDYIEYTLKGMP